MSKNRVIQRQHKLEQIQFYEKPIIKREITLQTEESHVTRKNEHGMTDLTPYNAFTGKMVYK